MIKKKFPISFLSVSWDKFIYIFKSLNPHQAGVWESLIRPGGGKYAPKGKLAIFAMYLHFRQQETYQGTLGTQRWTLIGSRTSHRPSMDPTRPLSWTVFSRILQLQFAASQMTTTKMIENSSACTECQKGLNVFTNLYRILIMFLIMRYFPTNWAL